MCSGARERKCWNSIGFNGPFAVKQVVAAITERMNRIDGLDAQFCQLISAAQRGDVSLEQRWSKLRRDEAALAREKKNFSDAVAQFGARPILQSSLDDIERRERILAGERHWLETAADRALQLPESTEQLRFLLRSEFGRLAVNSYEFAELLRELVPEFHIYLVRLCDGGHLLPRAKVKLSLLGSFSDVTLVPGLQELLAEELTIDLFDELPQRERIRETAVALSGPNVNQRRIAESISEKPTQTAVQRALKLNRLMLALGLKSPLVLVDEPPNDYNKLRRHKHHKYHFKPLEGYVRPTL